MPWTALCRILSLIVLGDLAPEGEGGFAFCAVPDVSLSEIQQFRKLFLKNSAAVTAPTSKHERILLVD